MYKKERIKTRRKSGIALTGTSDDDPASVLVLVNTIQVRSRLYNN